MKRLLNSPLIRISIIAIFGILEFALTTWLLDYVFTQFAWLDVAVTIVSLIILFGVIRNSRHLSADIFWILLIAAAPSSARRSTSSSEQAGASTPPPRASSPRPNVQSPTTTRIQRRSRR